MFYLWTILIAFLTPCAFLQAEHLQEDHQLVLTQQKHFMRENSHANEENKIQTFEKEIAYFFDVSDEEPVIEAYMNALEELKRGLNSIELEKAMVPHLETAYRSIKQQRNWNFDTHLAAKIEFQIILGNFKNLPSESVQDLMVQLYQIVFQSDSPIIQKAARLRTFLYQYKTAVLEMEPQLSKEDQRVMLEIARTSKELLNSIRL